MFGQAIGIFGVVIVPAVLGLELGDAERFAAEHRRGQFTPANIGLGEQFLEFQPRPRRAAGDRIAVIAFIGDDRDADRRAFIDGFQHIRPRQRVARIQRLAFHDAPARHRNAAGDQQ
ncbi:hypothetical protein D9M73_130540 [compost metagenome]